MKNSVKVLCKAALFTAIIFCLTAYLHIPSYTGYTHVGDAFVYLSACLLPFPYGLMAGVCGAVLADLLGGYAYWVPATAIIKGATTLCFSSKSTRLLSTKNLLALIFADLFCIGGYYFYDALLCGNFIAPLAGVGGYVIQSLLSNALFIVLCLAIEKQKKRASK